MNLITRIRTWILRHKVISAIVGLIVIIIAVRMRAASRAAAATSRTEPLKKGPIIESVYGIGTVVANKSFHLKTGVASTIRHLYVNEGEAVKKGQRLIDLDGTDTLHAPFDGTVTYMPVRMGETIFAQSSVLVLTDLRDRYLTVNLEQRGAVRVKQGQRARISFDSMRDQSFEGKVESVYSNDSNFLVRIGVKDLPPQILPGMSADVAIGISEKKDVLLIPVAAISDGHVQVLLGRRTRDVAIQTGIVDGAMAEMTSGELSPGDVLMIQKKAP